MFNDVQVCTPAHGWPTIRVVLFRETSANMKRKALLLCMILLGAPMSGWADERHDADIDVSVLVEDENVSVDVHLPVAASRELVWAVLTDFAHMSSFVTNLRESKVMSSQGNTLVIQQGGTAQYGPLKFPFDSTREIRLTPWDSIESRQISGNMRKMLGLTRLSEKDGVTLVDYHADSVPGHWIPPLVGKAFIAHELREQFQQLRDEMLRRKQRLNN